MSRDKRPRPAPQSEGAHGLALSRREFLKWGSLLGLTALLPGCGGSSTATVETPVLAPLDVLARNLTGQLLKPGDAEFLARAVPQNLRFAANLPTAVARCSSPADVQTALRWCQDYGVPLAVRSGGHNYAGYSTTSGLLLDTTLMNDVQFESSTGRAKLGGGAKNRDAFAALRNTNTAITHGRCIGVGVAGLTLGGGVGFNMRARGLTCDALVETEVVTADGQVLVCNALQNEDLFWACRGGGGGNFGVNTSFTFQTFPVGTVTAFLIDWETLPLEVFRTLITLAPGFPTTLGIIGRIDRSAGGHTKAISLGQFLGTPDELKALLAPLYALAAPSREDIQQLPYWDAQDILSEPGRPGFYQEASRYVYTPFDNAALDLIEDFMQRWPETHGSADFSFFLTGGAVDDLARTDTAYVHRGAVMVVASANSWTEEDDPAASLQWQAEFDQALGPLTSEERFVNFPDPSSTDFLRAYYGQNLERLIEVNRKYDPGQLFKYPQAVPV